MLISRFQLRRSLDHNQCQKMFLFDSTPNTAVNGMINLAQRSFRRRISTTTTTTIFTFPWSCRGGTEDVRLPQRQNEKKRASEFLSMSIFLRAAELPWQALLLVAEFWILSILRHVMDKGDSSKKEKAIRRSGDWPIGK